MQILNATFQFVLSTCIFLAKNGLCGNSNVGIGIAFNEQPNRLRGTQLKTRKLLTAGPLLIGYTIGANSVKILKNSFEEKPTSDDQICIKTDQTPSGLNSDQPNGMEKPKSDQFDSKNPDETKSKTGASESDQSEADKKPNSDQDNRQNLDQIFEKSEKIDQTEEENCLKLRNKQKKFCKTRSIGLAKGQINERIKTVLNFVENSNDQKNIGQKRQQQNAAIERDERQKRLKLDKMDEKMKQKSSSSSRRRGQMKPKKKLRMKPGGKKQSSEEEEIRTAHLPFGELEEEENNAYEKQAAHLNRSLSLGLAIANWSLDIANFCNEPLNSNTEGKEKRVLLADAIQLGLRNALCFYVERRTLPRAFELKLGTTNSSKLGTISELGGENDEDNVENGEEGEEEKATSRIVPFHHMLMDTRVESVRSGANDSRLELLFRAPYVFTALRAVYEHPLGITLEDLIRSVAQSPLKLFQNPAQSGATFLRTGDGQFFIKSADREEMQFFKTFLQRAGKPHDEINFFIGAVWDYYEYFRDQLLNQKRSLLPKYYAVFDLVNTKSKEKQSFIMTNSVFPSNFPKIHYKFDLKGASINRRALKLEDDKCAGRKTCRDLDFFRYNTEDKDGTMVEGLFRHGICIGRDVHDRLAGILENDTWFLKAHNIMDYSLLLGVHFIENEKLSAQWLEELPFGVLRGTCDNCKNPIRNAYENDQKLLLSIGIIDTLQTYDYRREFEDFYKSSMSIIKQKKDGFLFPPSTRRKYKPNSVKEPSVYRNRFLEAVLTVFLRTDGCSSSPTIKNENIHEKSDDLVQHRSEEFIFKAKIKENGKKTVQAMVNSSPSRQQLERRKQQAKILEDLKKLDLKIPTKFRKTPSKTEHFAKPPINRALSVPISFRGGEALELQDQK